MATVRREVRVARPPGEVWALVGDPRRLHEWFPGVVDTVVDGDDRTITLASGIPMPEKIVTVDDVARRFQYRVTSPLFRSHLGTIDVLDVGDGTSMVVYGTDAEPAVLALVVGGAAGAGLRNVKRILEEG